MSAHHHHGLYIFFFILKNQKILSFDCKLLKTNTMSATLSEVNTFFCVLLWMNSNMLQISFTYRHHHNGIQIELLIANIHKFGCSELLWTPTKHELWASKEEGQPVCKQIIPSIFLKQASCFFNYSPNHLNWGKNLSHLETPSIFV